MMDVFEPANVLAWAVQVAVIVIVAAPLPRLLRLWAPRARMAYWRVVLIGCLLLPVVQPWLAREAARQEAPMAPALGVDVTATREAAPPTRTPTETVVAAASRLWIPPVGLAGLLAAGMVLRLAWLALGVVTVWRLRRSAKPLWPRPPAVDRAATLAETDAEFLVSPVATRPVTCGLLWPVVLVPRNFESFPDAEQTAIACHELLHVARADWVRNTCDEVLRAVLWFHPAAWWAIDQIQLAREQVVDREVVSRLGTRQPYLEALLRMARPAPRIVLTPASLFLKRAHLRQRVALLVKEVSMSRIRIAASLAAMALVVVAAAHLASASFPLQQGSATKPGTEAATQKPVTGATRPGVSTGVGAGVATGVSGGTSGAPLPEAGGQDGTAVAPWLEPIAEDATTLLSKALPEAGGTGTAKVIMHIDPSGHVSKAAFIGEATPAVADAAARWVFAPSSRAERTTLVGFNLEALPAASGSAPVRLGGAVKPPAKIFDVKPVYPQQAREAGIEGIQIYEVNIDASGAVTDARVLRGTKQLAAAGLDALLRWKFTPATLNGAPVACTMTATVNFRLGDGPRRSAAMLEGSAAGMQTAPGVPYGSPTNWPPDVVKVGAAVAPPRKVTDLPPIYPADARSAGVEGVVILQVLVGPDGKVKAASILRSIPMLDKAAYDAVMGWEFTPTLLQDKPVSVELTVTVNFTLR